METETELRTVAELVREELKNDLRCRNDDKWLTWKVMRHFTPIYIVFEDFEKMPSFEAIRRCRAKIQNVDQQYLPTEATALKRRHRQTVFKQVINQV